LSAEHGKRRQNQSENLKIINWQYIETLKAMHPFTIIILFAVVAGSIGHKNKSCDRTIKIKM
jgi:hypothetical protein